jgi:hypothetical protein
MDPLVLVGQALIAIALIALMTALCLFVMRRFGPNPPHADFGGGKAAWLMAAGWLLGLVVFAILWLRVDATGLSYEPALAFGPAALFAASTWVSSRSPVLTGVALGVALAISVGLELILTPLAGSGGGETTVTGAIASAVLWLAAVLWAGLLEKRHRGTPVSS